MKSVSLKNLVDKLSKIGFDFWPGKTNSVSTDIGELCSTLLKLKGEASSVAANPSRQLRQNVTPRTVIRL